MSLLSSIIPQQTDEQFQEGVQARQAARTKVIASKATAAENVKNWTIAKVPQATTDAYMKYVLDEIAWWNANSVLTTRQVTERFTRFTDILGQKTEELNQLAAKNILNDSDSDSAEQTKLLNSLSPAEQVIIKKEIADKKAQDELLAQQAQQKIEKYGWQEAAWDAFLDVLKWLAVVTYIIIALRIAAFAANDYLYMPLPYRILKFIYTFIFMPVFFPYYMWREIKAYIWSEEKERPRFEATILPAFSYVPDPDPLKSPSFTQRMFGYRDIPEIIGWINKMRGEQNKERAAKIENTAEIRESLIREKGDNQQKWTPKEPIRPAASP